MKCSRTPASIRCLALLFAACLLYACGIPAGLEEQAAPLAGDGLQSVSQGKKAELTVQLTHSNHVAAISLSADGKYLATSSWDQTVVLWNAETGEEIRRFRGHQGAVYAVALSADGGLLLTGGEDATARLWATDSGAELGRFGGHDDTVTAVALAPDRATLVTASADKHVRLWRLEDGALLKTLGPYPSAVTAIALSPEGAAVLVGSGTAAFLQRLDGSGKARVFQGHNGGVKAVAVSPDGRRVLTGSLDRTIRLWSLKSGRELKRFSGHSNAVTSLVFSSDNRFFVSGSDDSTLRLWDIARGKSVMQQVDVAKIPLRAVAISPDSRAIYSASEKRASKWDVATRARLFRFEGNSDWASSIALSGDGTHLLIGSWDDSATLWNLANGSVSHPLRGHRDDVRGVAFSPDSRRAVTASRDGSARLWDVATGKLLRTVTRHQKGVRTAVFSPDGLYILMGGDDGTLWLDKAEPGDDPGRMIGPLADRITAAAFSPDGQSILASSGKAVFVWRRDSGALVRRLAGHRKQVNDLSVAPDGAHAASASWDKKVIIWDYHSGRQQRVLTGHAGGVHAVAFSPDGQYLASGGADATVRLWSVQSGAEIMRYRGHRSDVIGVAFSPDGQFVFSSSTDQTTRIWDRDSGAELCRLVVFKDGTWAVVDGSGLYDASNGGDVFGLHWVIGREIIALTQLKQRYYEPGLLAKKLHLNPEPIRDVAVFSAPRLYPAIDAQFDADEPATLRIRLRERGGGIGRVIIAVNGKEVVADARGAAVEPGASELDLEYSLKDNPFLLPGRVNSVEVKALNGEGYLASRGVQRSYVLPGDETARQPEFWGLVAGISDYNGDRIDLRYAAKDAVDMARALEISARRLFTAERTHMTLLTTEKAGFTDALPPTRKNLLAAFAAMEKAKPWDIVVVYLAGHGISVSDDYFYLTAEARSNDLVDPEVLKNVTVSASDLVQWLKAAPPLKQVMILDTCAAGAVAKALTEKREITSGQVRAIERLKDRTGLHVLMGSAANAVSYEASRFEQGLLTHALLQGIKGAALRESEYVDVSTLFQYAADAVPRLAEDIGGVQRPRIAVPRAAESFDIGQLEDVDRRQIPLSKSKPILLQPMLINADTLVDDLNLSKRLRARFRSEGYVSVRGGVKQLDAVYLDVDDFPAAIRPSGTYRVKENGIDAIIVLGRGGEPLSRFELHAPRVPEQAIIDRVIEQISQTLEQRPWRSAVSANE